MISDKNTNFVYFSELLKTEEEFAPIYQEIVNLLNKHHVQHGLLKATKDIWARDYMPIQVSKDNFIEYRYDTDYLQGIAADARPTKTYPDIVCAKHKIKTKKTDIILDGGNVVKSSNAVILADKVVKENAHSYSKEELIAELQNLFEVEKIILIPWDLECEFGHSDGMLRFIDDETVLISGFYDHDGDDFNNRLLNALKTNGIKYKWLECTNSDDDAEDNCFYINFLQVGELIIVPGLGKTGNDKEALKQIEKYFPKPYKVEQVQMSDITRKGGALNCITWTVKE
jgi:agmatine deiminase